MSPSVIHEFVKCLDLFDLIFFHGYMFSYCVSKFVFKYIIDIVWVRVKVCV